MVECELTVKFLFIELIIPHFIENLYSKIKKGRLSDNKSPNPPITFTSVV